MLSCVRQSHKQSNSRAASFSREIARLSDSNAIPPNKRLQSVVLGQAQLVVAGGSAGVAVFGSLPEFAGIAAGKEGFVFLALVHENGLPLVQDIARRERYCDFDLVQVIFLPRAAIQQHLRPATILGFVFMQGPKDRLSTNAVRPMRVG